MKNNILVFLFICCGLSLGATTLSAQDRDSLLFKQIQEHFNKQRQSDKWSSNWAQFDRYEKANKEISTSPKVIFLGNSITEGWVNNHPDFFNKNSFLGRGISGQVSSQMLVRFRADVINLKPKAVVINAGTNDIALNNGIIALENVMQNIISMCELAKANKIKPILSSVLPTNHFVWNPSLSPADDVIELNKMIKSYADANSIPYIDYYSVLVDDKKGLSKANAYDGVHPTGDAYLIMEEAALKVINKYIK